MTDSENQPGGGVRHDVRPLKVFVVPNRVSSASAFAIGMSRLLWQHRAERWDHEGSARLDSVVEAVLERSGDRDGAVAVDLGCGSGQVTFPLAQQCSHVLAVDINAGAIGMLAARSRVDGVDNVQMVVQPVETLGLESGSVDLVVSNYALHHLRDADKRRVIQRAFSWLRPGGRLVIGDMMFGRGANPVDREIIRAKVRALARRGPGGWWRIVQNSCRFLLRFQEKPLRSDAWEEIVREAGFENVSACRVVAEAYVVSAMKPVGAGGVCDPVGLWSRAYVRRCGRVAQDGQ